MKKALLAVFLLVTSAIPAAAGSITINSTNCNSSGGNCYGLFWTLDILSGAFTGTQGTYNYQATLTVADDPFSATNSSGQTISAVAFKATNSLNGAELISAPTGTGLWTTSFHNLSSVGCLGGNDNSVCSSTTGVEAITGGTLQWKWYFSSNDPGVGETGDEMHIGAKMTTLDPLVRGKLMSASSTVTSVPEPSSLSLLGIGVAGLFVRARKRLGNRS
ncbi:MAG TPA: PEP-CTERM sorting domain-containing protein [Gemmatimonadaceae bacterium]|nr:PEP-CTERM sorting domain-containing protein [Gemmatimonadaceae bacterium]